MPGSCPRGHRLRGPGQQRGSWTLRAAASRPQGSRCLWPSSLSPSAVSSPAHSTLPTDAIREDSRDGSSDFFPKGPKDSSRMFSKGPRGTSGGLRALGAGGRRASWAAGVRRGRGLRGQDSPSPSHCEEGHQRAEPPLGTPWRKDGVGEPAGPPLVVPPTCLPHRPAAATPCESPAAVTLSPSRSHRGDIW